jgi:hypothetical protein
MEGVMKKKGKKERHLTWHRWWRDLVWSLLGKLSGRSEVRFRK